MTVSRSQQRRRSATQRRAAPLHLIAALLIVAGLAMSTPPSCVCLPDDHFGLLLHPLFPHAHGGLQHPSLPLGDSAGSTADSLGLTSVDQAPGISAAPFSGGAHDAIAGLLLPLLLAALWLDATRRIVLTDARPEQRALAPPFPPPRLIPSVA